MLKILLEDRFITNSKNTIKKLVLNYDQYLVQKIHDNEYSNSENNKTYFIYRKKRRQCLCLIYCYDVILIN